MKTCFSTSIGVGVLLVVSLCGPVGWAAQDLLDVAVPADFGRRQSAGGPAGGYVEWEDRNRPDASSWDKTDYWAAIALSPSSGKFAASCEWMTRETAERDAREKCNAPDAEVVVVCGNGWCALVLDELKPGEEIGWTVGWAPTQAAAEQFARDEARERGMKNARLVYSIFSREMKSGGAIAYSKSTGRWGYSTGGGRRAPYMALKNCAAPDAEVIVQKADGWLALAVGDDLGVYGWGYAGNRADAERNALDACKSTQPAKIVLSFCTNGVVP